MEHKGEIPERDRPYDPDLDMWHMMAYSIAKMLKLRPLSIMKDWTCEELLVTFGNYVNKIVQEEYLKWKAMSPDQKKGIKQPPQYAMVFRTYDQLEKELEIQEQQSNQNSVENKQELEKMRTMMDLFNAGKGGGTNG